MSLPHWKENEVKGWVSKKASRKDFSERQTSKVFLIRGKIVHAD
jgi:hypothetical protein